MTTLNRSNALLGCFHVVQHVAVHRWSAYVKLQELIPVNLCTMEANNSEEFYGFGERKTSTTACELKFMAELIKILNLIVVFSPLKVYLVIDTRQSIKWSDPTDMRSINNRACNNLKFTFVDDDEYRDGFNESLVEFSTSQLLYLKCAKNHITRIKFASVDGPSSRFMFLSLIIFQCCRKSFE